MTKYYLAMGLGFFLFLPSCGGECLEYEIECHTLCVTEQGVSIEVDGVHVSSSSGMARQIRDPRRGESCYYFSGPCPPGGVNTITIAVGQRMYRMTKKVARKKVDSCHYASTTFDFNLDEMTPLPYDPSLFTEE